MRPLPTAIVSVLQPFACLFTRPTWLHVQVLLIGTLNDVNSTSEPERILISPERLDRLLDQLAATA